MTTELKKLFSHDSREALFNAIIVRIDFEKARRAKRRFFLFMTSSLISLSVFAWAIRYVITQFGKSEFVQYFSLVFSDGSSVLTYWKQFSLLLVESLPIMSILLLLSVALVTLYSLRNLMHNFGKMSLNTI